MRIGFGYDVHRLAPGHKLVLGGVEIPFERGLAGWSDADVLIHAIIDALLGAAALGDIGTHFPPGDPQYKGISSLILLDKVRQKLADEGYQISNVDSTITAERPVLMSYASEMRQHLSQALGVDINQVSVKASTTEELGFVGRGEGMAAFAVAAIVKE